MAKHKKIESERNLNYLLKPVVNHGGVKPLPFQTNECTFHSYINAKQFMMLDVLTVKIRERWKQKGLYEDNPLKRFKKEGGFHITFKVYEFYDFEFLKKYSQYEIAQMFLTTKVSVSNFTINTRQKNGDNKFLLKGCLSNGTPEILFEVYKDKSELTFGFPTLFGLSYVNNIILKNLDYYPISLYDMSNPTQNLYRKMFLPKWNAKELIIYRDDIKDNMNITSSNNMLVDQSILKSLKELKNNNIIKGFQSQKIYKTKRFMVSV